MRITLRSRFSIANLVFGKPLRVSVGIAMKKEANGCHVEQRITQKFESLIAGDLLFRKRIRRVYESRSQQSRILEAIIMDLLDLHC